MQLSLTQAKKDSMCYLLVDALLVPGPKLVNTNKERKTLFPLIPLIQDA
jgi:hypothetical protein